MTDWTQMQPGEFDRSALAGRAEREFVAAAPSTLFPRLLPESRRKSAPPAAQMAGQDSLFGEEDR
jgi:hypothetical protein